MLTARQPLSFLSSPLVRALLFSQVMALIWWLAAAWIKTYDVIPVWYDQENIWLRSAQFTADPYQVRGYVNPPWASVIMLPFALLPVPLAVLAQICLYFAAITGVIFRLGGGGRATVIALTSFIAFDNGLEPSIDWMTVVGLLLPPVLSAPFIFVKPQTALGYYAGVAPRQWLYFIGSAAAVGLVSLLVWDWWLPAMLANVERYTLSAFANLAPMTFLTPFVSIPIGIFLMWQTFRRRDPLLGVLAWLFFIPYIALYSLLLHFALVCVRFPRVALIVSVAMWIGYGRFLIPIFTGF